MTPTAVRITVTATASYQIDAGMLWPDGEAHPTAAKAVAELRSDLGNGCSVAYWLCADLIDHTWAPLTVTAHEITAVEVDVPNPAYAGDHVLFGDPPPPTIIDRAEIT